MSMTQVEKKQAMKLLPEDNMTDRFLELYQDCKLSGAQQLLLIFFFAHEEELRLLSMHPESLCCDTTFGTENTKKELFDVAGLDGNNKGFNAGRAYIPNAQQWVFSYIFKYW